MIFAQENNRTIPKEDKVFALNARAKAMIAEKGKDAVCNATVGALLDDEGNLIVHNAVAETMKNLKPEDYAEYAPIGGIPEFKEAINKALFGSHMPKGYVSVCATPGGTGAIVGAIENYTKPGDRVLTHDWCWANYKNICSEMARDLATFEFFDADGGFGEASFDFEVKELAAAQDELVVIINSPAHNPTGYALTEDDWRKVTKILTEASAGCRITLVVDVAYMDYAGDEEEVRGFISILEEMPASVLTVFAYSASKTLTLYGSRCGAMVCMTPSEEICEEFRKVSEYMARATWSNCNRAAQAAMGKIYADPALEEKVKSERTAIRDMLLERGRIFEKTLREEGEECVPFTAGFFVSVACPDPAAVSAALEKQGIFCVALAKGVRVSVAALSEEKCVKTAKAIAALVK